MKFPKTDDLIAKLKAFVFNKYRIVFIVFLAWMLFFDNKNVFVQFKLSHKIYELKKEKENLNSEYEVVKEEHKDLSENIEKFREKYFIIKIMKSFYN
ncbi:MAG: hypothetical protein R2771_15125 [Saprospiraceae bacterium]